ncbi:TadE family protein [Actinomadura sp. 6N118]|uniref:TadE family protein n=1 Tax=Actinomadura sp. 6N118 TaxID=3375151 RepID=UPI0037AD7AAA
MTASLRPCSPRQPTRRLTGRIHGFGGDRGAATLELAVIGPVLISLFALIIAAGRVMDAGGAMEAAARDGARQASIARTPSEARANALSSAHASLQHQGLKCTPAVAVDTSGFGRAPGTTASVRVEVSCTVRLADLTVPGMPGGRHLRASMTSPIDPYRGRG